MSKPPLDPGSAICWLVSVGNFRNAIRRIPRRVFSFRFEGAGLSLRRCFGQRRLFGDARLDICHGGLKYLLTVKYVLYRGYGSAIRDFTTLERKYLSNWKINFAGAKFTLNRSIKLTQKSICQYYLE